MRCCEAGVVFGSHNRIFEIITGLLKLYYVKIQKIFYKMVKNFDSEDYGMVLK